jgi:glycosyltransferase involved in cell wall biosynthesis
MKVAVFADTFMPQINGVTNTLSKLIQYYEENNVEYIIFAPKYEDEKSEHQIERFYSLKFFLYPECRVTLPNLFRVSNALSQFRPDLIHIMTEFSMGLTGLLYGKKHNIPTISNYTTNFSQYTNYYKVDFLEQGIWDYMRWFHSQNKITLCPSQEAEILLNKHGIHNTGIFSRGIDFENFHPKYRSIKLRESLNIDNKLTFLYVGRVSIEKDLDILSESYKAIHEKYGDKVALIITGDGPYLEKCKDNFPGNTIFTGFKRGQNLSEIYASCDAFVCPSSTETFGNVILEAMASGLPVIGADAGGIGEIINQRYNGLKFKKRDSKELTACMMEIIENTTLRANLIIDGRNYALNRSWGKIFNGLMSIYNDILNERKNITISA